MAGGPTFASSDIGDMGARPSRQLADVADTLRNVTSSLDRVARVLKDDYDVSTFPFNAGGSGEVYTAQPCGAPDVTVVLKILSEKALEDPEEHSRFRQEIRLSETFDHAHVMPIISSGETDEGDLWFIAPRASTNLGDYVPRDGIDPTAAVNILEQICEGVAYIHGEGAVHRDLSPGNVMLVEGKWVIADFGLSVSEKIRRTFETSSSASRFGTQDFVAPEQLRRLKSATARSDIYSLGKLFQFILTGTASAFSPSNGTPARASLLRATAEDSAARFSTPQEFLAAVRRELAIPVPDPSSPADTAERYIELVRGHGLPREQALAVLEWLDERDTDEAHERRWVIDIMRAVQASSVKDVFRLDPQLVRSVVTRVSEAIEGHSFVLDSGLDRLAANLVRIGVQCDDVEVTRRMVATVATLGARHNRYAVRRSLVDFVTKVHGLDMVQAAVSGLDASGHVHWVLEETELEALENPLRGRLRALMA